MKKIITHIFLFMAVLFMSISCNKDILNVSPSDSVTDDAVFNSSDPALLRAFVDELYRGLPDGLNYGKTLTTVSDESHMNSGSWDGQQQIMLSNISPSNSSKDYFNLFNWDNSYKRIRATNLFMSKIDASPLDDATKDELRGEVYFLRAYLYHDLVVMYGGVPLITKAYGLNDDFSAPRDAYADCIQYISGQCDSAAMFLPLDRSDLGRATKGAALTLKSRTLLYAASDLYNTSASSIWGSYDHPELVGYTDASSGDRQTRWQMAKDAAKAVIDLGVYSLYMPEPASLEEAKDNYINLFTEFVTSEDIFNKYYTTNYRGSWDEFLINVFRNPCGFHGWGSDAPTQQMVDSYEMTDGTAFSWDNPVEAATPYENRDPRFSATILYDGAHWKERPEDVSGDPYGNLQTGRYYASATEIKDGLDTGGSNGGIDTWNASWTGYYTRKCVDPALSAVYEVDIQTYPWRFMRYAEVLLNYAEACIELEQDAEARTYINMVRRRAYMPDIPTTTTGGALLQRLRNERKVELAFENLRYFDIRRWMICEETAYADVQGIKIMYGSPTDFSASYGNGTPTYNVEVVDQRHWDPKVYFLPIDIDEMRKNDQLIQNPGYTN